MGKPITGRSFGGCIRYVVDKQQAKILAAEGVRMQNANTLIHDFNLQRKMRPELGKAVGHLILSWTKEDLAKLNDDIMVERAKEYMEKVGIRDTQFVVVRHSDRDHPHLHLIYNRVDNNGKTISDKNNFAKNVKACKEITLKYGYHMGEGKQQVNRDNLRGKEKLRYEFYDAISKAIKTAPSWKAFEAALKTQGITMQFKYKGKTKEVQGISFSKGEVKFKGSTIDSAFSYSKLNSWIESNREEQKQPSESKSLAQQIRVAMEAKSETQTQVQTNEGYFPPGWFDLVQDLGNVIADDIDDEEYKRKKRYLSR